MSYAPIVLFAYKRLDTLIDTVEALQNNYLASNSDLIIYSDAAKNENDAFAVAQVRRFLKNISGFKSVKVYESKINLGLANSIINGVTTVLNTHESVIVLEDDLVTCKNFLNYMNQSLEKYKDNELIFSISGYSFDLSLENKLKTDSYFLNRGWSWGWATWAVQWKGIDWNVSDYNTFRRSRNERRVFSKGGSDLNRMLDFQMAGKLDSWAIRWFYHQYKKKALTLYPVFSKVLNIGFRKDATHTRVSSSRYIPKIDLVNNTTYNFPEVIEVSLIAQKRFNTRMGILSRLQSKLATILRC
jgi:hypothetical protein